ncbi:DUF2232 domain-containing protein [Salinithrix halophila]|uniref:DUF2232 domain-containing protein n=1 Tax=Salinithrix halophila TaxID=1485204 RepID=A0ABV8JFL6_9BACL
MSRFSDLRDGLITFGLFALLILTLLTPLSLLTCWFLPLPFLLHTARRGGRSILFPIIACGIFILLAAAHPFFISLYIFSAVTGAVMGLIYRRTASTGTDVVLGGLLTSWICLLLLVTVTALFTDFFGQLQSIWHEQWKETQRLAESIGAAGDLPSQNSVARVLPGMLILFLLPFPLLNFALGRRILIRQGFPGKYLPPFRDWRLPRPFFYFYFLSLLGFLFLNNGETDSIGLVFSNATALLYILFLFQGWAFTAFLLHQNKRSGKWMILVVSLSFIPLITLLLHLVGILDTGTKLRKRLKGKR